MSGHGQKSGTPSPLTHTPPGDLSAAGGRLVGGRRGQRGLADARLTVDQHEAAAPGARLGRVPAQHGQRHVPANEPRHTQILP
jgi:hypothetical protein